MELKEAFARSLRHIRKQRGLTQEDFSTLSSRTYLSSLERGLKSPTIEKLEELAIVMSVHPLTLLTAAYLTKEGLTECRLLTERVEEELKSLNAVQS
jgi:transcriptional regulator with XRE-family HTH domain